MPIDEKAFGAAIDAVAAKWAPEYHINIEILKALCVAYEAARSDVAGEAAFYIDRDEDGYEIVVTRDNLPSGNGNEKWIRYDIYEMLCKAKTSSDVAGDIVFEEIEPSPYINGFGADNTGVSYMVNNYGPYADCVLFKDGKPDRCLRFTAPNPQPGIYTYSKGDKP